MTKPHHNLPQFKNFFPLFSLFFFLFSFQASAYTEAWQIDRFHSELTVEGNGNIYITETIDADFTNEAHRGLERQIPYDYIGGYNTQLKFLGAYDNWSTETFHDNGYFILQMTTADYSEIQGPTSFTYRYLLENAILDQEDFQEIYWNINGTEWPVKTTSASSEITLNIKNLPPNLETICFTGDYGSEDQNCSITQQDNKITVTTTKPLDEYQGLTIGIKLPAGTIEMPTLLDKILWFILDNIVLAIPLLTFIIMFSLYMKYGRDEKTLKDTIIPHYTPPRNLLPSETGTLIDEKLDPRDITATIIDYAIKGFIDIKEIEKKNYTLTLKKPYTTTKPYEKIILHEIFPTNTAGENKKISELKNKFYLKLKEIDKAIMEDLVKEGYFPTSPSKTRGKYIGIGSVILFISIYVTQVLILPGISGIATALIIIAFGYFMPRKTQKGKETYYELKGLYEYIETAEKDRIKFQEDQGILFEKLLPYAIAFGLAEKWAKAFDGLAKTPNWYHPLNSAAFDMIYFSNALDNFSNSMITNLSSAPGGRGGSGGWSGGSSFGGGGFRSRRFPLNSQSHPATPRPFQTPYSATPNPFYLKAHQ